jgi:hypothetical protein
MDGEEEQIREAIIAVLIKARGSRDGLRLVCDTMMEAPMLRFNFLDFIYALSELEDRGDVTVDEKSVTVTLVTPISDASDALRGIGL